MIIKPKNKIIIMYTLSGTKNKVTHALSIMATL